MANMHAGLFGAARYGRGHNIASMDCFSAAIAMVRMGQHFGTTAVKQQKKHHCMQQLLQQRKSIARSDKQGQDGANEGSADSDDPEDGDDSDWDFESSSSSGSSRRGDSDSGSEGESCPSGMFEEEEEVDGMATFLSLQPPRPSQRRAAHAAMSLDMAAVGVRQSSLMSNRDGEDGEGEDDIGGQSGSERVLRGMAVEVAAATASGSSSEEVRALACSSTTFVLNDLARVMQHMVKRGEQVSGPLPSRQVLEAYAEKVVVQTIKTTQAVMNEVCGTNLHTALHEQGMQN
jgi:hypothetical protein